MQRALFRVFVSCLALSTCVVCAASAANNVLTQVDSDGTLHFSVDGGYEWTSLSEHLGGIDPHNLRFYLDHEARLFYSTDGGYAWSQLQPADMNGLEIAASEVSTATGAVSPVNNRPPLILSVDRDGNAWLSFDGGYEWISEAEFERQSIDNNPASDVVGHVGANDNILHFRPHPLEGNAAAILNLHERSQVRLALYDLQGREVAVLADGMMTAGEHNIPVDAEMLNQGVYSYSLQINQTVERGSVSVAR